MTAENDNCHDEDMLFGADAIAAYLGFTQRQLYAHIRRGHLPIFRIGAILGLRKSTFNAWLQTQEEESVRQS